MSKSNETVDNSVNKKDIDLHIYNAILEAILNRQLQPGVRLVEAPLCNAFGVTRGVIRRVFVKLAHDQIIKIEPNRGAIVAEYDIDEAKAVFEARSMLELGTVKKLAKKSKSVNLKNIRELVKKEENALSNGNWQEWVKLSGDFHIELCEVNSNPLVTSYLQTLIARTSLLIRMYDTPTHHSCSVEEHKAILDAIEEGDEQLAIQLMEDHLEDYASIFLKKPPVSSQFNLFEIFQEKNIRD
ncbi:GntR family transcriptional regulator (plasmid) [Acinetobacter sp. NCu2D-2]|uniref:GntR family transcriptional regulator n=1 Tax=Acinetobacter sp. NCu2D-2 TaxID=1608473 RepID=UPI0007CDE013|nr:GntR family transcriptional regulator [Acinetobacter sp. NCu2D-2]ANF83267.1 GntR family transcriptional regulator [Acinetobacter sp. NCu2D-2]